MLVWALILAWSISNVAASSLNTARAGDIQSSSGKHGAVATEVSSSITIPDSLNNGRVLGGDLFGNRTGHAESGRKRRRCRTNAHDLNHNGA